MKIGILTYHRSVNYGAFLQAVALCRRLNAESGISAEIIDYNMKKADAVYSMRNWDLKRKLTKRGRYKFGKEMKAAFDRGYSEISDILSAEKLCSDDMEEFRKFVCGKYDVIIAGSDEIWRIDSFRGFPTPYWLIGDLGCRKFSYAASSRSDFSKLSEADRKTAKEALNDFEVISVRDNLTYDEIKKELGSDDRLMLSCDPSFLYDFPVKKDGIKRLAGAGNLKHEKSIIVMTPDRKLKNSIKTELGSSYNLISVASYGTGYISLPDLDPFEWLDVIADADFVITSFFHGACFSICLNTPFLAVGTDERIAKIRGLLEGTAHENRLIENPTEAISWRRLMEKYAARPNDTEIIKTGREAFDNYLLKLKTER